MGVKTEISWTDSTWNPLRGCSRVSEGCRNCYAEKVAYRFSGAGQPYEGLAHKVNGHAAWTGKVMLAEKHLLDPLKWKPAKDRKVLAVDHVTGSDALIPLTITRPRRIFVNSMSDLFHESVQDEWIEKIFAVMALCPQHTFQVLTKRPERMLRLLASEAFWLAVDAALPRVIHANSGALTDRALDGLLDRASAASVEIRMAYRGLSVDGRKPQFVLPNLQLGVSVENQPTADARIPLLLQTPAAVRFISAEPLLGEITFRWAKWDDWSPNGRRAIKLPAIERDGRLMAGCVDEYDGLRMLDWVIVGGESGPGARPMHPDWARSLRDQCQAAGVPFFFKQWGEWGPGSMEMASGQHVFRQFDSFQRWTHKGDTWINGGICLDATGKQMKNGADMKAATYPVTVIHRVGKKAAGSLLDGREWKEFPR